MIMKKLAIVSLSMPAELVRKIDSSRNDVPRSRFVVKLLERVLEEDD